MQGDFIEHINVINSLSPVNNNPVSAIPVRTPADLERCKALVIPGGESTSISIGIQQSGLFEAIKAFVKDAKTSGPGGKAVYGSCAGMILCSKEIEGPVSEGWLGLDGMDVKTARNAFGRQLQSFSYPLSLPFLPESSTPYVATFIRAPLIHSILDASSVNVLARLPEEKVPTSATAQTATGGHAAVGPDSNAVLLQQGRLLISSWHPELNKSDHRLHEWWLKDIVLAQ